MIANESIVFLRNTPDEIAQTVIEAIQGSDYIFLNRRRGEKSRQAFEVLNQTYGSAILGKIGLYFSEKHSQKLFQHQVNVKKQIVTTEHVL